MLRSVFAVVSLMLATYYSSRDDVRTSQQIRTQSVIEIRVWIWPVNLLLLADEKVVVRILLAQNLNRLVCL